MISHKTIRIACLLAGSLLLSASAFAEGKVEVAAFGGGLTITDGGTHALAGGSADVRVIEHLRLFGEFSYTQLSTESMSYQGVSATAKDRLYNYGGGVDVSFGSSKRVVPYFLGVVGVGHQSLNLTASAAGISASANLATSNAVYIGGGGGVRLYVGNMWGFKPEFRYHRYTGSNTGANAAVFTFGFFYQFGK
jgi:hypothetical protein